MRYYLIIFCIIFSGCLESEQATPIGDKSLRTPLIHPKYGSDLCVFPNTTNKKMSVVNVLLIAKQEYSSGLNPRLYKRATETKQGEALRLEMLPKLRDSLTGLIAGSDIITPTAGNRTGVALDFARNYSGFPVTLEPGFELSIGVYESAIPVDLFVACQFDWNE